MMKSCSSYDKKAGAAPFSLENNMGHRGLFRLFMLFAGLLLLSPSANAAGGTPPFPATQCAADRFDQNLNCTANDLLVSNLRLVGSSPPATCFSGQSITVDLLVTVSFGSADRYDVGVFFPANDAGAAADQTKKTANGGPSVCSVKALTIPPFSNLNGNVCGDGGDGDVVDTTLYTVTVPCKVAPGSGGKLSMPYLVSYTNSAGATCTGPNDVVPGTVAKCNAPSGANATVPIVVVPAMTITDNKTTTFSGDSLTYIVVITNSSGATMSGVSFSDPNAANLSFTGVSCSPVANCPAASIVTPATLTTGIPLPDIADGASLTFTITATVTGNPTSITNTATVTVGGQTASVSDTDNVLALLAEYHFDETTWNGTADEVKDSSGNGYHASAAAARTASGSPGPAYSAAGQSTCGYGVFDGGSVSKSYVRLPDSFPGLTGSFSLTAWINSTNASAQHQRIFVRDDDDAQNGWALSLADGTGTGKLRFFNRNVTFNSPSGGTVSSGGVAIDTTFQLSSDTWYFVAFTVDTIAKTAVIYVYDAGGVQRSKMSASFTGTWGVGTGATAIGGETSASTEGAQTSWHFLGRIDEVRIYSAPLTQTLVEGLLPLVRPCAAPLHHYGISYPNGNPGITCEALAVRVAGHDSSDVAVAPPAGTEITLSTNPATGGWAKKTGNGAFVTATSKYTFDGSETFAEFWLTQTTALANIDLGVSDGTHTEKTCASNCDGTEDERAQFANAAFRFYADTAGTLASIGTQTAGVQSASYYLRAVRTDASTGTCTAALQNQTTSVSLGYQCNNPATCYAADLASVSAAETKTVARNNNGSSASGTAVSMAFDSNGYAPFTFNYKDVGEITLLASKTLAADNTKTPPTAATTLAGSTGGAGANGGFVVKPYGFKLSGLACDSDDRKSTAAGAFCVAGGTFTGTVTSVIYDSSQTNNLGAATPSFGHEATAQTVSFSPGALVMPTAAAGGTLDAFASSTVGSFSGTPNVATATMVWPNVGTITIKPTTDYLGAGDLGASGVSDSVAFAGNVGRFYPDHFTLASGTVTPACTSFTYMGQPNLGIAYAVEARNKSNAVTSNYLYAAAGGYDNDSVTAGNQLGTVTMVAENADAGTDLAGSIGGMGTAPVWTAGKSSVSAATATYARSATTPAGPYDALAIGASVSDPDAALAGMNMRATTTGVCTTASDAATDCNAVQLTTGSPTKLRFGRLWLGNVYGSDQRDLSMPFEAQYWNGSAFVRNQDDSCTSIAKANIGLGNFQPGAPAPGFAPSMPLTHIPAGPFAVAGGRGAITIGRPVATGTPASLVAGSVDLVVNLKSSSDASPNVPNANWTPGLPAAGPTAANLPYLQGRWSGANYDRDPVARATFGIFGSSLKKGPIYIRENF